MKIKTFCISILASGSLYGVTPMNDKTVQHFTISDTGLTRVSIENDQISDMFVYPGTVSDSVTVHPSGHLFIAPSGLSDPIFLTVISAGGEAQDMKISFGKRDLKPIILKNKEVVSTSKEQLERWFEVSLLGQIPRGFKRESPRRDYRYAKEGTAREVDHFSNGHYEIGVYEITSQSKGPLLLTASSFLEIDEAGRLGEQKGEGVSSQKLIIIWKKKEN